MKKTLLPFILALCWTLSVFAQTPNQFKYQAVLRDASGAILASENATISIAILQGADTGPVVFSESHAVTSNEFGLIEINIGSLLNGTGTIAAIDWSTGIYFVQVSLNGSVMGTKQLMSVPYALYADVADSVATFDYNSLSNSPDLSNWDQDVTDDFDGNYNSLSNLPALFDGDYNSLSNIPTTITTEQSEKIDYLTLTHAIDLDSLQISVDSNSNKVSFPGFGTTAGTALEGNTPLWTYSGGNMYHLGKVGANIHETQVLQGEALRVGGGILYEGYPTSVKPGMLFYNPQGEGSFRYYNNIFQEKILGKDTVKFVVSYLDSLDCVGTKNNFVIDGSMAIGFDAVNGEDFGYNTLILKENNLRILLEDTDDPASGFPSNDWLLMANESSNGGDNCFAICDETAQTTPFKVMAGAGDHAFIIDANGNVGIGLENPAEKLEVNGNIKANAFIGDGSALTGITGATGGITNVDTTTIAADTDANGTGAIVFQTQGATKMIISNDGKVGIGTTSPSYALEVVGTGKFGDLLVSGNIEINKILASFESDTTTVDVSLDYDVLKKQVVTFDETTGNVTIEGFQNGVTGQEIVLVNRNSAKTVVIKNNGTGTQKVLLPAAADITLATNSSARFIFDGTTWYCIGKNY
ncbi:MAG: hypothetical protein JEZ09_19575 [Salinivirgaceae bacterium]|nr:hypothetical protein [Salinivirgaceae bacterium]